MTIPRATDGHGSTLTFAGFAAHIISIDGPAFKRAALDATHLGTVDAMDAVPAKLVDPGEISIEVEFDPAALPPIQNDPQALAITWDSETPATWTWSNAFLTSFKTGAKSGDTLKASLTFKVTTLPSIS